MQPPYDNADEPSIRFYNLYARIVIAWSRIERAVDMALFAARRFSPRDSKAIVSWKHKATEFSSVCGSLDDATLGKARLARAMDELAACVIVRHTLVHGYCHGLVAGADPPQMHFRSARYNPSGVEQRTVTMTHDEMFRFLKRLHRLDFEIGMMSLAVILAHGTARRAGRPPTAQA